MNNEEFLNDRYEDLIKMFRAQKNNDTCVTKFMYSSEIFPSYFAGAHLTDHGCLELQVTNKENNDYLNDFFQANL